MQLKEYLSQLSNGERKQFEFNSLKQRGEGFLNKRLQKKFETMDQAIRYFFNPIATPQGVNFWLEVSSREYKNK